MLGVRFISTRATAARRAQQRGKDAAMMQYLAKKRVDARLREATSISDLNRAIQDHIVESGSGNQFAGVDPRRVSMLAYKIGQFHKQRSNGAGDDPALKSTIIDLIERNLDHFSVSSTANILASLPKWRWQFPKEWGEKLTKRLLGYPRLKSQTLSRAIPGIAALGVTDTICWNRVTAAIELQLQYFDQESLARCLVVITRANQGDLPFFTKMCDYIEPRVFSLDPGNLSRIAFSLSIAKSRSPNLESIFSKLSSQILLQLPMYNYLDLKMVVSAFTTVAPPNTDLLTAVADRVLATATTFSPAELAYMQQVLRKANLMHPLP